MRRAETALPLEAAVRAAEARRDPSFGARRRMSAWYAWGVRWLAHWRVDRSRQPCSRANPNRVATVMPHSGSISSTYAETRPRQTWSLVIAQARAILRPQSPSSLLMAMTTRMYTRSPRRGLFRNASRIARSRRPTSCGARCSVRVAPRNAIRAPGSPPVIDQSSWVSTTFGPARVAPRGDLGPAEHVERAGQAHDSVRRYGSVATEQPSRCRCIRRSMGTISFPVAIDVDGFRQARQYA